MEFYEHINLIIYTYRTCIKKKKKSVFRKKYKNLNNHNGMY